MPDSTSNLSVDEQQDAAEDDITAVAQAITTTAHREQEDLIATVAVARP
jgi:hypothetical protein